jgi:hypothetical protein
MTLPYNRLKPFVIASEARFPDAVQRAKRVYGRERAFAGAPQIRDRCKLRVRNDPGSAAHHFMLRCARDTNVAIAFVANAPRNDDQL